MARKMDREKKSTQWELVILVISCMIIDISLEGMPQEGEMVWVRG
jgi:hypothetical protein